MSKYPIITNDQGVTFPKFRYLKGSSGEVSLCFVENCVDGGKGTLNHYISKSLGPQTA